MTHTPPTQDFTKDIAPVRADDGAIASAPQSSRAMFATKIGAIAATVGSAVGLGNIWRFPYEAGTHGGGMFLLCYVVFVIVLGIPLMCSEFIIGRYTRSDVTGAFQKLSPGSVWHYVGYLSILASVLIMGFYCVVAGWTMEYLWESLTGGFGVASEADLHEHFLNFSSDNFRPLFWTLCFLLLNYLVLARGVTKGIEKMSNIMMPMLFVILIAFCVYAFTMSGFGQGVDFFFKPDMKHFGSSTILGALGQTFFSLSLGMGCMITYGSYLPQQSSLQRTSGVTVTLGTLVAFLAGVMIFPAVFTYGISPQAGPQLIFEALPSIFSQLPAGMVWSALFFFLLIIASLSSTISLSEISISYLMEQRGMGRQRATAFSTGACALMAVLCTLSYGCLSDVRVFGLNFFNLFDYVASNILLPVGGLAISVYVGWILPRHVIQAQMQLGNRKRFRFLKLFVFIVRFIAPAAIVLVFLGAIGIL